MSPLPEAQARSHPAYLGSLHTAACRAVVHRNDSFAVYMDGEAIFVQNANAPPPTNAALVCTAKHWHGITVQVSFRVDRRNPAGGKGCTASLTDTQPPASRIRG
jgi:hypothetical protein